MSAIQPPSEDPSPRSSIGITVPAGEGRAVAVPARKRLRITTPFGRQAADFFAYDAAGAREWLSAPHTWSSTRVLEPREGQTFLSQLRRPLAMFVEDAAGGVHDMLIAACDQARYGEFGVDGYHRSCSENLQKAMSEQGIVVSAVPQPINFFTNTKVTRAQRLVSPPNPVPAGSYVVIEALVDLICVVSACPFDLPVEWWSINSEDGPSELLLEVVPEASASRPR